MRTHQSAVITIAAALLLDIANGLEFAGAEHVTAWRGLYWAVATATTVGYGDVTPKTGAGQVIAVLTMLTVIPLFAASISLFTAGLSHVRIERGALHSRLERIERHLGAGDE